MNAYSEGIEEWDAVFPQYADKITSFPNSHEDGGNVEQVGRM